MNQGCNATVFEHELTAFELPPSVDRSPPHRIDYRIDYRNVESRRLHSFDELRLTAPVLTLDASDVTLLPEPNDYVTPRSCSSRRSRAKYSRSASTSPPPKSHRHQSKKASRKQVHELQTIVNAMQEQVDGAASQLHHLSQLVGEFARQRQQQHERFRRQQQVLEENEMDMDLDDQQHHLRAQVEHDREQFEREQRQQYQDYQSPQSPRTNNI